MEILQPLVVGLNIKSVSVETLEKLSIHHSDTALRQTELAALAGVKGALILSTCNRLEFYAVSSTVEKSTQAMRAFLCYQDDFNCLTPEQERELQENIYQLTGEEALKHLYRVVSGLDSMVLGETEILGQVARAYETARAAGATDRILNVWFQRALAVGKKARSEFGMDKYHTSVGRIAVDLAEQELGNLSNKQILILGAGEMSELTAKHLISKTASLVMVSNRSLPKAQVLAAHYGFEACSLDLLPTCLEKADLVFSATASKHYLVSAPLVAQALRQRTERPLVFIDMAVPRDIDPRVAELAGVRCFDIKELHDVSEKNHEQRKQAALLVESLIDEKITEFYEWLAASEAACDVELAQEVVA